MVEGTYNGGRKTHLRNRKKQKKEIGNLQIRLSSENFFKEELERNEELAAFR